MISLSQLIYPDAPVGLYTDQFGRQWRQDPNGGGWQLSQGLQQDAEGNWTTAWANQNPNAQTATVPYDLSGVSNYLGYTLPSAISGSAADYYSQNPDALNALFAQRYSGRDANTNPYGSTYNADALRQISQQLGLSSDAADQAALRVAQNYYTTMGQPYNEGTHPNVIADRILVDLAHQAGINYQGAPQSQIDQWNQQAADYSNYVQSHDNDSFGQGAGPIAEYLGVTLNSLGNNIDWAKEHPDRYWVEGPVSGNTGATPAGARLSNWVDDQLLGGDGTKYDSQISQFGDINTDENLQNAATQGYDPSFAALLRAFLTTVATINATRGLGAGIEAAGLASGADAAALAGTAISAVNAYGSGGNTADIIKNAILTYLSSGQAGEAAKLAAKAYQAQQAYEHDNPGAAVSAAGGVAGDVNAYTSGAGSTGTASTSGEGSGGLDDPATYTGKQIKVGDFDSNAITGSDSPYNANSFFDDTTFGNNFAGDNNNMYDANGNWIDGTYDQNGNFVPNDGSDPLANQLDQYGTNYGNDPFSQDYTNQLNTDFGGTADTSSTDLSGITGILKSLGGLIGGAGSSISGLLSGSNSGTGNNLLALAPILAAIQHARQQGPFDTSRLTSLADTYNPSAMADQYDRNTESQRQSLTSSLADRGVMGSSFGNMDITNFNTNRELGRGALVSQASLGGADIANKILQAQIQQRSLQNQLYGSSLYALGNVFGRKA